MWRRKLTLAKFSASSLPGFGVLRTFGSGVAASALASRWLPQGTIVPFRLLKPMFGGFFMQQKGFIAQQPTQGEALVLLL
jgi:hypothetical protein